MKYILLFLFSCSLFCHSIDVILPVHKKDAPTLELVIEKIRENISDVRRVIVISKEKFTESAEWVEEKDFPFTIDDVGNELGGQGGIGKNVRRGWYYQQLLKFYAHFVIDDLLENILIFDADTVPNKKMSFFAKNGAIYMDIGSRGKTHFTYFIHLRKLLPLLEDVDRTILPVVHHMVFNREVIIDLFKTVEDAFQEPFWKVFCNQVITNSNKSAYLYVGASEYLIYYHYCMNYFREKYVHRVVRLKDDAETFSLEKFRNYDFVSVHQYDRRE